MEVKINRRSADVWGKGVIATRLSPPGGDWPLYPPPYMTFACYRVLTESSLSHTARCLQKALRRFFLTDHMTHGSL